ncbi:hypothetical protein Q8A73_012795 [Channa argus]|nr:hypothetical protein Q8A73_012795 [Channa argus]
MDGKKSRKRSMRTGKTSSEKPSRKRFRQGLRSRQKKAASWAKFGSRFQKTVRLSKNSSSPKNTSLEKLKSVHKKDSELTLGICLRLNQDRKRNRWAVSQPRNRLRSCQLSVNLRARSCSTACGTGTDVDAETKMEGVV